MQAEPFGVVVLGASSQMALALLETYTHEQDPKRHWMLVVRKASDVQNMATQLSMHHQVSVWEYDMLEDSPLPNLHGVHELWSFTGWLPANNSDAEVSMRINYLGVRRWVDHIVETQRASLRFIMLIGSMAGVRVRPSNAAYGAAKQMLHAYAADLQRKLKPNVAVSLVIPGYVQTRMLPEATPGPITLSPVQMAAMLRRVIQQKPERAYSQPFWKMVAWVLPILPNWVVAKMR